PVPEHACRMEYLDRADRGRRVAGLEQHDRDVEHAIVAPRRGIGFASHGCPVGMRRRRRPVRRGGAPGQAIAVIGSMMVFTSDTLLAGKPDSLACSCTAASLSAR